MHSYDSIQAAALDIVRRRPAWLQELPTDARPGLTASPDVLAQLCRTINSDRHDPSASDQLVRQLIDMGRSHPDAITILLAAVSPRIRSYVGSTATADYHTDVISSAAMYFLQTPTDRPRIAARVVNCAHNATRRERESHRLRGRDQQLTVDPCGPDLLGILHDSRFTSDDIADNAVLMADLIRFRDIVTAAQARRHLPRKTWEYYCDLHLRREFVADLDRTSTDRVRAHRAIADLQPLIERHLSLHAA